MTPEDHFKKMFDQTGEELIVAAGTFAVLRHLLKRHDEGSYGDAEVVRRLRAELGVHDAGIAEIRRIRAANHAEWMEAHRKRVESKRPCGICAAGIWWNANEPTGQARGWRHVDQVAAIEFGSHRATPHDPMDAEPQHPFVWSDPVGWCEALLSTGKQCCAGQDDPIHLGREAPKPVVVAEPEPPPITWDGIQEGAIICYRHVSRARRLANRPLLVRTARVEKVYRPGPGRVEGQISISALNKNGTVNKTIGRTSLFSLDFVVSIETPAPAKENS